MEMLDKKRKIVHIDNEELKDCKNKRNNLAISIDDDEELWNADKDEIQDLSKSRRT